MYLPQIGSSKSSEQLSNRDGGGLGMPQSGRSKVQKQSAVQAAEVNERSTAAVTGNHLKKDHQPPSIEDISQSMSRDRSYTYRRWKGRLDSKSLLGSDKDDSSGLIPELLL